MDRTTEQVAGFVTALTDDALTDSAIHEAKRRLVDSLGCAIAAIDSPPAAIARTLARESGTAATARGATALGLGHPTTIELAAFANSVMVRYLDFNDMYLTARGGGGHPSDLIAGALAVGQALGSSGMDVIRAIVIGYEVNGALASGVWLRERGWDQGLNIVAAASMMAGSLFGLDAERAGHALALAVTPNVPVRQTRVGHLSMWKGCATAGAVRNGIFAARLARAGMTGPPSPFEGASGIWELVTGPFEISLPVGDGFVIEDVHTKTRPAEFNAQGALDLILEMRDRFPLESVDSIDVETYRLAWHEIGSDAAKWDPRTRETADHSLPYLLAVALVDGLIDQDSCSPERVVDPTLRPLMDRIHIAERADFTAAFPGELNTRITVRLLDGSTVERQTAYPRGHRRNPLTDAEMTAKFEGLAARRPARDRERCATLVDQLWQVDAVADVATVMAPLAELSVLDSPIGAARG